MASYLWAPDSAHLLFDSNGRLWIYDLHNGTGVETGFTGSGIRRRSQVLAQRRVHLFHARPRPRGGAAARIPARRLITVAPAPNPAMLNGEVDWVYEEELETRSNYFWSPDSKNLAFLQMNESDVPEYPITDWIPTHAKVDLQRYPQPGDPNPEVRVGVVGAWGGKTVWIRLPDSSRARITFRASAGSIARRCGSRR